jgi:hypothetical protein
VTRECHQVGADVPHVDGDVAEGLGGVEKKEDIAFAADATNLLDRLDRAGDIAGVERCDKHGRWGDGAPDIFGIDHPGVRVEWDAGHVHAIIGQRVQGAQDRVVIRPRGDHVGARRARTGAQGDPLDGEVQGVGRVQREDDVIGCIDAEQRGDPPAAELHTMRGLRGLRVSPARGSADRSGVLQHGLVDARGLWKTRGGVVEEYSLGHALGGS